MSHRSMVEPKPTVDPASTKICRNLYFTVQCVEKNSDTVVTKNV